MSSKSEASFRTLLRHAPAEGKLQTFHIHSSHTHTHMVDGEDSNGFTLLVLPAVLVGEHIWLTYVAFMLLFYFKKTVPLFPVFFSVKA